MITKCKFHHNLFFISTQFDQIAFLFNILKIEHRALLGKIFKFMPTSNAGLIIVPLDAVRTHQQIYQLIMAKMAL
jgi:hypothetical protein